MRNPILNYQSLNTDLASLLLRILVGGLFIRYGYTKLAAFNDMLPMFGDPIGIGGKLSLILVIFAELVCGFLVAIGFLTRLTVIPIFITMSIAFFVAHANDAFDAKSLVFVYWILSMVIFVLGSGKFSADRFLINKKRRY